jgi:hypothetical protein
MRGGGYADVLPVLQVPDNKADAVPCERLQNHKYFSTSAIRFLAPLEMTLLDSFRSGTICNILSVHLSEYLYGTVRFFCEFLKGQFFEEGQILAHFSEYLP